MTFLWPGLLLMLGLIPLLVATYFWMLRRRRKFAVRYSSIALIRAALPKYSRWRQHLPFALFLGAVVCLSVAMARPAAVVEIPLSRTSIILALDVSRSMCAVDVPPNRLTVAQEAALGFIEDQADGTQIGIVAFAGFAQIVVPPTTDKEILKQAVASFTTSFGTAIGSATLESIDAIAAINSAVQFSGVDLSEREGDLLAPETYVPDIIVLLTDGANSQGPNPLSAAQRAADRGVRVYTIGFGTSEVGEMVCSAAQLGSDSFGGGFGGNFSGGSFGGGDFRRFIVIDETMLRGVADITGGQYFRAENAEQLIDIFNNLPTQIVLQKENLEISVFFAAFGALLASAAVGLSLLWNRYS